MGYWRNLLLRFRAERRRLNYAGLVATGNTTYAYRLSGQDTPLVATNSTPFYVSG